MKIVFLDRKTIGDDLNLEKFNQLGEVVEYNFSNSSEILDRVKDADIIITNKCQINENTISSANNLKLVCVTATGTNNLDKEYLLERNIKWRNVANYSTDSVAQHTFAMTLFLLEKLSYYDKYVKDEHYINDVCFTHFAETFSEIAGKTWGIIGLGNIGKKVTDIAETFGAKVIYYSTSGNNHNNNYNEVDFDTIISQSDILSIHAPLTNQTEGLINYSVLSKMKPSSILINVGRGPIVNETDLVKALNENLIAGAGLDVLKIEPMSQNNPLASIKDSKKLLITPHIAWASVEARNRLMDTIYQQIKEFLLCEG